MKTTVHALLAALALCAPPVLANDPATATPAGFKPLFDGRSLENWDGDSRFWRVENGSVIGETTPDNWTSGMRNTFLIYRGGEFGDFELRFRYKVHGYNSGVQYRSVDKGEYLVHGLQADFEAPWHEDNTLDRFSGMFFEEGGRMFMGHRGEMVIVRMNESEPRKPHIEKIASLGDPKELAKAINSDDWNEFIVIANGNQFTHIINGQVMCMAIDEDQKHFRSSGIIAFQIHGGRPMRIEVKDVIIRQLD